MRERLRRTGGPFVSIAALALLAMAAQAGPERALELTETVRLTLPSGTREVRLWVPKPPTDGAQTATLRAVDSPWTHRTTSDAEFGNETLFFTSRSPRQRHVEISLRYEVRRREQRRASVQGAVKPLYLQPRGLLVIDDEIRRIARETARGLSDPFDKAQAFYYYVLSRMRYDKTGKGWGRGDSVYACRVGRGNCTDFHSLFMAMAMAEGIPTRFRMGYAVPEEAAGEVAGYHCWAEFHAGERGWVPVDISEGWKKPSRAAYYFGNLDENRVLVSTGRGITLSPQQAGEPLNFLSRPYAEADGKPLETLELTRQYRAPPRKT